MRTNGQLANGQPVPRNKRHFMTTIDPDLVDGFLEFMEMGDYKNQSQVANALIRMALAVCPDKGILKAERMRAFNDVKVWTIKEMMMAIGNMRAMLESTLQQMEGNPNENPK